MGSLSESAKHESQKRSKPLLSLDKATEILRKHCAGNICKSMVSLSYNFNTRNTSYLVTNETNVQYVLRYSASWPQKLENEVACILYLSQQKDLFPIPKVVGYYSNVVEDYDYLLMTKIDGVPLGEIFEELPLQRKKQALDNVVKILKKNQSLKFDKIGSFVLIDGTNDTTIGPSLNSVSKEEEKGCGPFSTYLEYLETRMRTELNNLSNCPFLLEYEGPQLIQRVKAFMEKFICNPETTPLTKEVLEVPFVFCHTDLHSYNVLVDETTLEITGVIDFEFSGPKPIEAEWYNCCSFLPGVNKSASKFFNGYNLLADDNRNFQTSNETNEIQEYFFHQCKMQKVKTPEEIPGYETRAILNFLSNYICPWWVCEAINPEEEKEIPEKLMIERTLTRERLKSILSSFGF